MNIQNENHWNGGALISNILDSVIIINNKKYGIGWLPNGDRYGRAPSERWNFNILFEMELAKYGMSTWECSWDKTFNIEFKQPSNEYLYKAFHYLATMFLCTFQRKEAVVSMMVPAYSASIELSKFPPYKDFGDYVDTQDIVRLITKESIINNISFTLTVFFVLLNKVNVDLVKMNEYFNCVKDED